MVAFPLPKRETSQELRMLSSVTINCQVSNDCHEFRFPIVRIVIRVADHKDLSLKDNIFLTGKKKDRKKTDGPKKKKTRTTFTAYQVFPNAKLNKM